MKNTIKVLFAIAASVSLLAILSSPNLVDNDDFEQGIEKKNIKPKA